MMKKLIVFGLLFSAIVMGILGVGTKQAEDNPPVPNVVNANIL